MMAVAVAGLIVTMGAAELPAWTFDQDLQGWVPNAHLANVAVKDGLLCADAVDWDPFFTMTGLSIEAKPWQYVVVSLKADKGGRGELFWTGETTGPYGGFSQEKSTAFAVAGDSVMQDVVLFPFWQTEGTIRQLRLDVYGGAHFGIDAIRVLEWGAAAAPKSGVYSWKFGGDTSPWRVHPGAAELFAPPLNLAVKSKGWAAVTVKSEKETTGSILWSAADTRHVQTADFPIPADPNPRTCNVELEGIPEWHDPVAAFGIRLPEGVRLESIAITDKPQGPADLAVTYVGFENAVNRTSTPCHVIAQVVNNGGAKSDLVPARLVLSPDLRFAGTSADQTVPSLEHGETGTLRWVITSPMPGAHKVLLKVGAGNIVEAPLTLARILGLPKADYVPEPRKLKTDADLCAFYFPGWDTDAKWDCIRRVAPIRKPALGYYDESSPECVDWQIKWAVENGIACFLVDWYWVQGAQSLTHWFEAYRKARYRDLLKVAIMWANHNPPNTHSAEDWRNVTRHWIDHYFNLPAYYRIDDKPAVFIWAPDNVRNDLKGSEAVKKALDESQEMAREAGYPGITFVAMGDHFAPARIQALLEEGYAGITTYHEWGTEAAAAIPTKRMSFESLVTTAPQAWAEKNAAAGKLTYYPVVDTGWDSRPWHGDKAFVIEGRTPTLFERLLQSALTFARANGKGIIVIGPMNEWGEGSYIEPCVEFGFDMLEAIKNIFGRGNPKRWPVNVAPGDVGLGPYDYPVRPPVTAWNFDRPQSGWKAMMGVADLTSGDGHLRFKTTTGDPAIMTETCGAQASDISTAVFNLQLTGPLAPGATGQLFWSSASGPMSEAASVRFPLAADGQPHDYMLDLKANPRWRGRITVLRFDPCDAKDIQGVLGPFQLKP
jgi:hypothetical protein